MSVFCKCCVLSGRCLCDELITRPGKSYRLWFVVVCDLETSYSQSLASARRGGEKKKTHKGDAVERNNLLGCDNCRNLENFRENPLLPL